MNPDPKPFSWRPIVAGGLICGVLDINAEVANRALELSVA